MNKQEKLYQSFIFWITIISLFSMFLLGLTIILQSKQISRLVEIQNYPQFDNSVGFYDGYSFAILTQDRSYSEVKYTMLHEFAHYLYFNKMSKKDRDIWEDIHDNSSDFTTEYAMTNAEEDYAETFAYVMDLCINMNHLSRVDEHKQDFFITQGGVIIEEERTDCSC